MNRIQSESKLSSPVASDKSPIHITYHADSSSKRNINEEAKVITTNVSPSRNNLECVKILLEHGSDVNAADDIHWYTPLHLVAQDHKSSIKEEKKTEKEHDLMKRILGEIAALFSRVEGVEINYQDYQGNTPLHHAAILDENVDGMIIKALLENGANPNIKNLRGQTPLLLLCYNESLRKRKSYLDTLTMLLDSGARVNLQSNQSGCTPLHLTLYCHDIESSVMLVRE